MLFTCLTQIRKMREEKKKYTCVTFQVECTNTPKINKGVVGKTSPTVEVGLHCLACG